MSDTPRTLQAGKRTLDIEWSDGSHDAVPLTMVRERCRCAECTRLRRGRAIVAPNDVSLVDIVPCGGNAVQLVFSDGHARGIFPFSYLRELAKLAATSDD